jgi:hypothetical protein
LAAATQITGTAQTTAVKPGVNPWAVALTVTLAAFMELLDRSIANVSLPYIAGGLGRLLVGLGSAALEIFLDRGQIDEWFGSA